MIDWAGWWTQTPSVTPLQPKEWNACFWITFNFWCSAGLVNGFEPHLPPLCCQKHEMLIFGLHSTSDDRPGWSMDSNPICHPSPVKKWNACFWITFNFWWSVGLVDGLEPHLPPLSSQKHEILIFGLCSTSDDWPGWSMDWSPVCHLSAAKKMKCPFSDYIQLLMIGRAGQWTRTPSATPLQPKKWNAHFWITFNFWWSARLVNGLKSHLPPISSQKNEMLIFGLHSTPDDRPGWLMDLNPIYHLSPATKMKCSFLGYVQLLMISQAGRWTQTPSATHLQPKTWNACFWITFNFWWSAGLVNGLKQHLQPLSSQKKWNAHFWITFNFWWSARLVDALKPHLPPLSSQKNEMLIFGLHSTADDRPGWSMDLNPIYHLSQATKMKCSFLDYVQLLMIGRAGQWTWALCATSLQPKKWNAHFWVTFNFWWLARLVDGLKPHLQPLYSQKKWNAHFWITFNFWWLLGLINWLKPHPPPLSTQKNELPIFALHSNSDDKPGWSMDSNSICHASPAKKIQCSFLEYVQLLMIGQAGWWTQTPSATPLQPKKWNPHFWNTFNFWWLAGLVDGLEPHLPPLSSQKN